MLSFKPFKNAFGLDISDLKLRLIQFKKSRGAFKLQCFNELDVPPGYIVSGEIKDASAVQDLVKKLINHPIEGKVFGSHVVVSLPERRTFIKVIEIPQIPEEEIPGAVKWETERHIPISIDEMYLDWQLLQNNKPKDTNKLKIMVAVAPKLIIDSYTDLLKQARLEPIAMETESTAITRCLINEKSAPSDAIIIVDIGASRTSLIIYDSGAIQYSSTLEVSGNGMTNLIAQKLNLSFEQAEKAKIICGLDEKKGKGVIKNILEPINQQLIKKIQESISFYQTHFSNSHKISNVLLCGGVAQMKKLNTLIEKSLSLVVQIGNPLVNLPKFKKTDKFSANRYLSFTTAIGLALHIFNE